jgi:methionine aminotransferase
MSKMALESGAINLSQGYPDFPSDPQLLSLVREAMEAGYNQYAPMPGFPDLNERVSEKVKALYGRLYDPKSEVTITAGATQAIFTALACSIHKGDEVIIFSPAYDCYEPTIELFGGIPIALQLRPPAYTPDWDEVAATISPRTRMIVINSPHNPSGTMLSMDDMLRLQELAVKHDLLVLSDEVYEHIVFDNRVHISAARLEGLADRSFITASFGKTFHNTGWKTGYCLAPQPLMKEFRKVHQYAVFSVNHPIQRALAIYMEDPDHYLSLGAFYQKKRDYFLQAIKGSRFAITPSSGTYFQLLDYSAISDMDDISFTKWLTREKKVAAIPTSVFNQNGADFKQIRVCFAKKEETLLAAAKVLSDL